MFGISQVSAVSVLRWWLSMLNSTSSVNPRVFQSTNLYGGVGQMHFLKHFMLQYLLCAVCHYSEEIKRAATSAWLLHASGMRFFMAQ